MNRVTPEAIAATAMLDEMEQHGISPAIWEDGTVRTTLETAA